MNDQTKDDVYVVIRDMSAGNDEVGEAWQETKIFPANATLNEVMEWAMGNGFTRDVASHKRITITRPDNYDIQIKREANIGEC